MRRLFGPMGNSGRQDVLLVTKDREKSKSLKDNEDFGAWAAHHKAKQNSVKEEKRGGQSKKAGLEKGDGRKSNIINPRTERRAKYYLRNSAYCPFPKCPQRAPFPQCAHPSALFLYFF